MDNFDLVTKKQESCEALAEQGPSPASPSLPSRSGTLVSAHTSTKELIMAPDSKDLREQADKAAQSGQEKADKLNQAADKQDEADTARKEAQKDE